MSKHQNKHEFALFAQETSDLKTVNHEYVLHDKDLVHRLVHVLRVSVGSSVILFDAHDHVTCEVVMLGKKESTVRVLQLSKNKIIEPAITWLLPLLERDPFEDALTMLTVMGATDIQPVVTEKSRKAWGTPKERERAQRIMIAAAEQSKQFMLPIIHETAALQKCLNVKEDKLFFDAQGNGAYDVITQLRGQKIKSLICLIGPEGDLTVREKELVRESGFVFCKLTPTILRASHAVTVGMGIMRSCL